MSERSYPSVPITLEVFSYHTIRIYNWVHYRLAGIFFMLDVVLVQHENIRDETLRTKNEITKRLTILEHKLNSQRLKLKSQHECNNLELYTGTPSIITLNCTTPQSKCSASLLIHFDQLAIEYEYCWLQEMITREEKKQAIQQWKETISQTLHECNQLRKQLQKKQKKIK